MGASTTSQSDPDRMNSPLPGLAALALAVAVFVALALAPSVIQAALLVTSPIVLILLATRGPATPDDAEITRLVLALPRPLA